MKTIYLLYSLIVFTILSSCTKLERIDYQNIPADQFFKTEADAKVALTSYYSTAVMSLNSISYSAPGVMGESQTEMMEFAYTGNLGYYTNHFFLTASQYSSSLGNILASYSTIVKHISRGTNLIPRFKTIPMDSTIRKRYIAEIRALRAHCALWGYYMYGGVELFLNPDTLADVTNNHYKPRATQHEMANFIVSEIDAVKNDLVGRYAYSNKDYGRITRGAALMIKLKVLMQEKRFSEAETAAREIMTLGYALVPVYKNIFTLANEGNIETIWSVPCLSNLSPSNNYHGEQLAYDLPTTISTIAKWGTWTVRWGFYDSFDPLDERRKNLIAQYTSTTGTLVTRGTGSLERGCINLKYEIDPNMTGNQSGVDWIIFRYADVLLLLAEAINENNNGPTQEAIDLVNQIRARAFPNLPAKLLLLANYAGDKTKFNTAILNERGWELYMEWHRRQDLVRHGKFVEQALTVIPHGPVDDHLILWPIPPTIVDQSKGIVTQNPGY
jgi:hypothetical protein